MLKNLCTAAKNALTNIEKLDKAYAIVVDSSKFEKAIKLVGECFPQDFTDTQALNTLPDGYKIVELKQPRRPVR
jgi:hypothetical protein